MDTKQHQYFSQVYGFFYIFDKFQVQAHVH